MLDDLRLLNPNVTVAPVQPAMIHPKRYDINDRIAETGLIMLCIFLDVISEQKRLPAHDICDTNVASVSINNRI